MPDANSSIPRGKTLHGGRGFFGVNGQPRGYAQSVDVSVQFQLGAPPVMDTLEDVEHVVLGYTVSGSLTLTSVIGLSAMNRQIMPTIEEVFGRGRIDFFWTDRPDGQTQYVIEDITFEGWSLNISKGQISSETIRFRAKRVKDVDGNVFGA